MAASIPKLIVENFSDEELIDYLIRRTQDIEDCLTDVEYDQAFKSGIAVVNVQMMGTILRAYREKKFGEKSATVL